MTATEPERVTLADVESAHLHEPAVLLDKAQSYRLVEKLLGQRTDRTRTQLLLSIRRFSACSILARACIVAAGGGRGARQAAPLRSRRLRRWLALRRERACGDKEACAGFS